MIDCIIFDCDGTLVDSEYLCNLALELKLREYGVELHAQEMLIKYRRAKLSTILESLESDYKISLKEDFIPSYRKRVGEFFEEKLIPCDGVVDVLDNLDYPIFVASSGPIKKIEQALSITGLSKYFDGNIFSSYQINSWKPSPEIFHHAANKMGFRRSQCAVVEDSEVGIQAAVSAGMLAIHYNPHSLKLNVQNIVNISDMRNLHQVII
jgi:HAD superfamily hydrolase (TIGR01509 family)